MDGLTGTVGQETVTYSWDGVDTLTATGPRGVLFTVQVTNASTGAYQVTLVDNVLHDTLNGLPGDDTENNNDTSVTYTITDSDSSTTTGALVINFDDDIPSAYSVPPGTATGANTPGTTDTENLNLPAVGADDPAVLDFGLADGSPALDVNGDPLIFNGLPLFYSRNSSDPSISRPAPARRRATAPWCSRSTSMRRAGPTPTPSSSRSPHAATDQHHQPQQRKRR